MSPADAAAPPAWAVVLVDLQNDYCHPQGAVAQRTGRVPLAVDEVVAAAERLAAAARRHRYPVIWLRMEAHPDDHPVWLARHRPAPGRPAPMVCRAGSWGAEFYGVQPAPGDWVVSKTRYSGFLGTDLPERLERAGITHLAVGGVATEVCVESTVRDAFQRNFWVATVPEACGSPRPEAGAAALQVLGRNFGEVVPLAELVARWDRASGG